MLTIQNMQDLTEAIKRTYKSLERPDFSFIRRTVSLRPYESLVQQIRSLFEVEEITDSNDDVSFRYLISKRQNRWVLELSMIGRYATFLRTSGMRVARIVPQNTPIQEEQKIISFLSENQVEMLTQEILEQPISLRLFNTAPKNACIYHALFSDTDVLPWKAI